MLERSLTEMTDGPHRSENADISNEKQGGNPCHRNPKVSRARFVLPGLVGP